MVLRTANKESAIKDSASSVTDYVKIAADHRYLNEKDETCEICGEKTRDVIDEVETVPMYRMYNPNSGEHFYTGSTEERDILIKAGREYRGIGWYSCVK